MYHHGVKPALVDAAEAAFARHGLRATIDDVAREAGVSRATVYRHVRDRDELVLAVFAREADRFLQRLRHFLMVQRIGRAVHQAAAIGDGRATPTIQQGRQGR